ncbi:MAG: hypothetical protein ACK2UM_08145 [Anaerolineales bacterium]|jgi:hypothetical protein
MGTSFSDIETLVMTLVACLVLIVTLIVVGGETGIRDQDENGHYYLQGVKDEYQTSQQIEHDHLHLRYYHDGSLR